MRRRLLAGLVLLTLVVVGIGVFAWQNALQGEIVPKTLTAYCCNPSGTPQYQVCKEQISFIATKSGEVCRSFSTDQKKCTDACEPLMLGACCKKEGGVIKKGTAKLKADCPVADVDYSFYTPKEVFSDATFNTAEKKKIFADYFEYKKPIDDNLAYAFCTVLEPGACCHLTDTNGHKGAASKAACDADLKELGIFHPATEKRGDKKMDTNGDGDIDVPEAKAFCNAEDIGFCCSGDAEVINKEVKSEKCGAGEFNKKYFVQREAGTKDKYEKACAAFSWVCALNDAFTETPAQIAKLGDKEKESVAPLVVGDKAVPKAEACKAKDKAGLCCLKKVRPLAENKFVDKVEDCKDPAGGPAPFYGSDSETYKKAKKVGGSPDIACNAPADQLGSCCEKPDEGGEVPIRPNTIKSDCEVPPHAKWVSDKIADKDKKGGVTAEEARVACGVPKIVTCCLKNQPKVQFNPNGGGNGGPDPGDAALNNAFGPSFPVTADLLAQAKKPKPQAAAAEVCFEPAANGKCDPKIYKTIRGDMDVCEEKCNPQQPAQKVQNAQNKQNAQAQQGQKQQQGQAQQGQAQQGQGQKAAGGGGQQGGGQQGGGQQRGGGQQGGGQQGGGQSGRGGGQSGQQSGAGQSGQQRGTTGTTGNTGNTGTTSRSSSGRTSSSSRSSSTSSSSSRSSSSVSSSTGSSTRNSSATPPSSVPPPSSGARSSSAVSSSARSSSAVSSSARSSSAVSSSARSSSAVSSSARSSSAVSSSVRSSSIVSSSKSSSSYSSSSKSSSSFSSSSKSSSSFSSSSKSSSSFSSSSKSSSSFSSSSRSSSSSSSRSSSSFSSSSRTSFSSSSRSSFSSFFSPPPIVSSRSFSSTLSQFRFTSSRPNGYIPECGNGLLDNGENCDDGNNRANDGCSPICDRERSNPPVVLNRPMCGNAVFEEGEECDDGNLLARDGCSSICSLEIGYCGDGLTQRELGEQCDGILSVQGLPYSCGPDCRVVSRFCGDDKLDSGEECDNGPANSDAANAACRTNCSRLRCGDGILDGGEQCDDGNPYDYDGCSRLCRKEAPGLKPPVELPPGTVSTLPATIINLPQPGGVPPSQVAPPTPTHAPEGPTGPAAIIVMCAGAAAGYAFIRRRRLA